jgi:ferrous iron transport protein A
LIPLSSLRDGESAQITIVEGGRTVNLRMNELGFTVGTILKVIRNVGGGPIMVELKAGKIAIGRGIARKIMCRRSES